MQQYLKLAIDFDLKMPTVAYHARCLAMKNALALRSPENDTYLYALMDFVESVSAANCSFYAICKRIYRDRQAVKHCS